MKHKELILQNKNVFKAHCLLIFLFIGVTIFLKKKQHMLTETEIKKIKQIRKYSVKLTIMLILSFLAFLIAPIVIQINSLYILLSILFPGCVLFYVIIYFIGISELRAGHNFIYPFVGE